MAFNRIIKLFVYEPADAQNIVRQTEISALDMEFIIEVSTTFSENIGEFIVFNAKEDTRNKILKKGNNLTFQVGYEDETVGTIYSGNITEAKSILEEGDWVTMLQTASVVGTKKTKSTNYITLSYSSGVLLAEPLRQIAVRLGLNLKGSNNANIVLNNGWAYAGESRGALDYCRKILRANGFDLYRNSTELTVYRTDGQSTTLTPVLLTYDSGLLSAVELNDSKRKRVSKNNSKRIEFKSLIIPKIQPNGSIVLRDTATKLDGTYTVEKLKYEGDNFGGDNVCTGEAVA